MEVRYQTIAPRSVCITDAQYLTWQPLERHILGREAYSDVAFLTSGDDLNFVIVDTRLMGYGNVGTDCCRVL